MTNEEKVKAYDEALKRAKEAAENGMVSYNFVSDIFPELKESDDEKVKKSLIELVKQSSEVLDRQNQDNMIAWLEKQGSPILSNSSNIGKNEQKYANKVEPQFNVGDLITVGNVYDNLEIMKGGEE